MLASATVSSEAPLKIHSAFVLETQATPSWQVAGAKKKAEQAALISAEWRWEGIDQACAGDDRRNIPGKLLSEEEATITEIDDAAILLSLMASGKWSACKVCFAFAKRASIAHKLTNCITEVLFQQAFERATELDEHFRRTGTVVGPLHGLPVSLKDQFDIAGIDSTMGFVSLIGKPAPKNSVLVDMLESLGAIIICKTNVPQTLMAEETNNHIFGRTSNPINAGLISGGSSGGEGALVALKGSMVGFGTDFAKSNAGGSIRKPSTYCGLYGLRPTTRRLPYQGVTNVLHGFKGIESVIGPMARSVSTLQLVTKALVDAEPWFLDARVIEKPWSLPKLSSYLRIALMRSDGLVHNHPPLQRGFNDVEAALRKAGHQVIDWAPFDHVFVQQLFADLGSADGGADVRSFITESGEPLIPETFSSLSSPAKSVHETSHLVAKRDAFRQSFLERIMNQVGGPIDLIICPTAPHVAPRPLGAPRPSALISWTTIWSLLDLPACTLPVGTVDPVKDAVCPLHEEAYSVFDQNHWDSYKPEMCTNAPIVLQLVGPRRHREEMLLGMVQMVEEAFLQAW